MRAVMVLLLALTLATNASAAKLSIGLQSDIVSLDPHVAPAQTAEAVLRHVYDTLVDRDIELHIVPSLATAWRTLDDTHWEFTLRLGVQFSDGTAFGPEDVAFSINRAQHITNAAGTYAPYVRVIKSVTVTAPDRVLIETTSPYPQLPDDLQRIKIVSAKLAAHATTEDFNRRTAAIGTGPYVFVSWTPGEPVVLTRNPLYWGAKPDWDDVVIRPIASDPARLTALLSGAVDLIDKVPTSDLPKLRANPAIHLAVHDGSRSMFLAPNFGDGGNAYLTDESGARLVPNPLLDVRVRRALSLAINRPALVDRVLEGMGSVANQIVPRGMFGYDASLPELTYDPAGARQLLAEAGYPHGLHLVLHCSNGRYANDQQTCLAVAQMLARAGLQMQVQAEPQSVFYPRLTRQDFALVLNGWGSDTGDSIVVLRQALHSVVPAKGLGGFNRGHYTNAEADQLIEAATGTLQTTQREAMQARAMHLAMEDGGVIPLYTSAWTWGSRSNIVYQAGFEEGTLASRAHPSGR